MRIPSGKTDQNIYFVAVDSTDLKTRETGLTSFTVYRCRNGGTATAYTTPTVTECSAANMPGVYTLLIDEDTTIAAGSDSEEYTVHITQAAMAPVTRSIELYRRDTTTGRTMAVDASGRGLSDIDTIKTNPVVNAGTVTFPTTATLASTTNITAAAGCAVSSIGANVITATAINADAITDAKVAADVTIASVTGAVGSVTGLTAATVHADLDDIQARLPAALTAGGKIKASMDEILAVGQSATDLKDFADDGYDPATNKVQGVVLTDTVTTYTGNTVQTGDAFARLGAPAGASVSADILAIDNFVDDLESRIGTPSNLGSGATIAANLVDIEGQTDDIGVAGAGLTAITSKTDNLPASPASTTNITGGTITTVTNLTNAPTNGDLTATMKASVNTEIDAAIVDSGLIVLSTTIASVTTQGVFDLTSGSSVESAYKNCTIIITKNGAPSTRSITRLAAYTGATRTVSLNEVPDFTISAGDYATIIFDRDILKPETRGVRLATDGTGNATFIMGPTAANLFYLPDDGALGNYIVAIKDNIGTPSNLGSGATVAGNLVDIESQTDDIGVAGAGLTALATQASVNTIDDFLDTEIAAIKAKTDQFVFTVANQVDSNALSGGGGLDAAGVRAAIGLASANLDTQLGDLPTNAELAIALGTADDAVLSAIAALPTDADVQTAATAALNAYDPPTRTEATSDKDAIIVQIDANETKIDTIDTVVDAVKAKTDQLTFTEPNQVDANAVNGGGSW